MASVIMDPSKKLWNSQLLTDLASLFETGGAYNEATCANFHQLLVTTLLAYGHALFALKATRGSWKPSLRNTAMFIFAPAFSAC